MYTLPSRRAGPPPGYIVVLGRGYEFPILEPLRQWPPSLQFLPPIIISGHSCDLQLSHLYYSGSSSSHQAIKLLSKRGPVSPSHGSSYFNESLFGQKYMKVVKGISVYAGTKTCVVFVSGWPTLSKKKEILPPFC